MCVFLLLTPLTVNLTNYIIIFSLIEGIFIGFYLQLELRFMQVIKQ